MAVRAHAVTKYEIQYGTGRFKNMKNLLKTLIETYTIDSRFEENTWYVYKDEFEKLIKTIENMREQDYVEAFHKNVKDEYDYPEVWEALTTLYEEGKGVEGDEIIISWF